MKIALHDSDYTGFPNYALMKLSAWHKAQGDHVEWWIPMVEYDKVYSSKIFTFSPEEPNLPEGAIKGGTGYGLLGELPQEIDAMFPDYSLYPKCDHAIGFLTRGCIRNCPWCIVPKKEGKIRPYRTWREVKRESFRDIVFMDNNVLACDYGIEQMADMIGQNMRIDFNQGLDARLITPEAAEIIGEHEIAEYLQRLNAEREEAFSYLTFLLREYERADCRACKHYGACSYDFRDCHKYAEYMPEVTRNNNQRKNQ